MTLEITKDKETTLTEIHGFQVIGKDVKFSVKVGEKTVSEKNMFKEKTTKEIELEEGTFKLSKNMTVSITKGKDISFYYNQGEVTIDASNEC